MTSASPRKGYAVILTIAVNYSTAGHPLAGSVFQTFCTSKRQRPQKKGVFFKEKTGNNYNYQNTGNRKRWQVAGVKDGWGNPYELKLSTEEHKPKRKYQNDRIILNILKPVFQ